MFSIALFIFGPKTSLVEGGNTRAIVRDPITGNIIGDNPKGTVKKFRGREGYAEDIDFKSGRVSRGQFINDVVKMLKTLDEEFAKEAGHHLWDRETRDDILDSGNAFSGSSKHLFSPQKITDEEYTSYKPKTGDIDLMVPEENMIQLYKTLNRLEHSHPDLTDKISYIGHNKASAGSDQINALFAYTWDSSLPEGRGDVFFQVDFEGSEFKEGRPTDWASFSHSSDWDDVKAGIKGVAHKLTLFALAAAASPPPINARWATPKATAEKPNISYTTDKKTGKKIPTPLGSMSSFDVVSGLGARFIKLDWTHDGNEVYKYLKRSERTSSTRDIKQIFEGIFGNNPPPSDEDVKKFGSFIGLLQLINERLSPQTAVNIFERLVFELFGAGAQPLSVNDVNKDIVPKNAIIDKFKEIVPDVAASTLNIEKMKEKYYSTYKVRVQADYVEDADSASPVKESRRLFEIVKGQ